MTASEAIERIDEVLHSEYYYDETLGYQLTSDDFEWLEKAKQALEKQVPKKPLDKEQEYDGEFGLCPNCKKVVSDFREFKICYNCGQALDWSDTE